tara:strand:- start:42 stop:941 length:900 start_codon:yes stop_codon:yes gene_type:complete
MMIITEDIIERLNIGLDIIYNLIEDNIINKNNYKLPCKSNISYGDNNFFNTMPCILDSYYSCKIVSRNTNNRPSISGNIMLYDIQTSNLLSILECKWITKKRTAAVAIIATKYLACSNFKDIVLIGLGETIYSYMEFLLYIYPNHRLTIHLIKYKDHDTKFIKKFNSSNITWKIHNNINDAFKLADIIVSGITYKNELFVDDNSIYKKGVLIIPIHTKGFQNCDLVFDRVIVDDDNHVKNFKHYGKFKNYYELTDIIKNKNNGRKNDDERIISYNIGLGIHDNKLSSYIYNRVESLSFL